MEDICHDPLSRHIHGCPDNRLGEMPSLQGLWQGFYLTNLEDQALKMATKKARLHKGVPVVLRYEFNPDILASSDLRVKQFLVNPAIDRLTAFLMEDRRISLEQTLDTIYASRIYDLQQDKSAGLTAESPAYIYELMKQEFLRIIAAEHVSGYLLKLTFNNGGVRFFRFLQHLRRGHLCETPESGVFPKLHPQRLDCRLAL